MVLPGVTSGTALRAYPPSCASKQVKDGGSLWELSHWQSKGDAVRLLSHSGGAQLQVPASHLQAGVGLSPDDDGLWDALLQHHLEKLGGWTDAQRLGADAAHLGGVTAVAWRPFLESYWQDPDGHGEQAPLRLIVRIAQECARWIKELCERPRHILRRERRLTALSRVQDIDTQCLRWMVRQSGRTLAERAGPRQRILAVARRESMDTLENRVLRDFLELSVRVGSRYIADFKRFTGNKRLQDVQAWVRLAGILLQRSPIAEVSRLVGRAERNYVLQYDPRYSDLWRWYDRLRRQEDERESLLPWQHRLWADYVELALSHALAGNSPLDCAHGSPTLLRHEADHGAFLDARTTFGPWVVHRNGKASLLRILRSGQFAPDGASLGGGDVAAQFAWMGADTVVAVGSPFAGQRGGLQMGVWSLFEPVQDDGLLVRRLERLSHALRRIQVGAACKGMLVVPTGGQPRTVFSADATVVALCLPVPGIMAAAGICDAMRVAALQLLGVDRKG